VRTLALIPAKGRSRGLPGKNIAELGAHPLIAYSIAAGLQAAHVDRVMVSTDSEEIATIARRYGAEVPFLRPAQFAADDTRDFDVYWHALQWLEAHDAEVPDIIVQLRPTSPLRTAGLLDEAVKLLVENPDADSVRSVCKPAQTPYKMWQPADDGSVTPLLSVPGISECFNAPRQRLPVVWWQTGAMDVFWARTLRDKQSMTGTRVLPLEMPAEDVVDIDSLADLERAQLLLESGRWVCPQ
jgi:CMP-N,N'-diacetyllegionaminic acid synthase